MAAEQTGATPRLRTLGTVRGPGEYRPDPESHLLSTSFRRRPGEDIMHPMFVKLFIETDADDLLAAEEARRRSARRSRRNRPAMAVKAVPRDRSRRPQR
jgi:hypothetical protein